LGDDKGVSYVFGYSGQGQLRYGQQRLHLRKVRAVRPPDASLVAVRLFGVTAL
jgi:hypothetical protein